MTPGSEATVALAGRGEASELAVLVDRVAHPVDAGVLNKRKMSGRVRRKRKRAAHISNGIVSRVNHNDFEILVSGVLRKEGREEREVTVLA